MTVTNLLSRQSLLLPARGHCVLPDYEEIMAPVRYRIHHTPDCFSHRIGGRGVQFHEKPGQFGATPFRFRGVKPFRSGGEVKTNTIHSASHSISCNCTNTMRSHSSWASQLSNTIDIDMTVQVDSVSCNCIQEWVHVAYA